MCNIKNRVWALKIPPWSPKRVFLKPNKPVEIEPWRCPLSSLYRSAASDHFSTTTSPGTLMSKNRSAEGGAGHCLIWTFHLSGYSGTKSKQACGFTQSSCNVYILKSSTVTVIVRCCYEQVSAGQQVHVHKDPILFFLHVFICLLFIFYCHGLLSWVVPWKQTHLVIIRVWVKP